jgi:putative acetyltransferase
LSFLHNQYVVVAENGDKIVGFCLLSEGNYLDLLYVHKDYQGQKIAFELYKIIENEAKRRDSETLTSDVSKTVRAFLRK